MDDYATILKEEQELVEKFKQYQLEGEILAKLINFNAVGLEGDRTCFYVNFRVVDGKEIGDHDRTIYNVNFVGKNSEIEELYKKAILFIAADNEEKENLILHRMKKNKALGMSDNDDNIINYKNYLGKNFVITVNDQQEVVYAMGVQQYFENAEQEERSK